MPNLPPFSDVDTCPIHKVANITCGGPHRVLRTTLGDEMLAPGEKPLGTPIADLSEQEQQAHMEAEANAQRDDSASE
jgi:hypothetical protein